MSSIIPNDNVVNHFARLYGLSSMNGPLEKQLFEKSKYKKVKLRDILRACFGGVANNPSKSLIFLATDYNPKTTNEIARDSNRLLWITKGDPLKKIKDASSITYFEHAILKLSYFAEKNEKREKKETKLASSIRENLLWKNFTSYLKTWDGFLIGDPFAYLGISSSVIPDASSGYKIWGIAASSGETNAQEISLLMLYWLQERNGQGREIEFIREVFEFNKKTRIGGKLDKEYTLLQNRLNGTNLSRLSEAGIINYDYKKGFERITYKLEKDSILEEIMKKMDCGGKSITLLPRWLIKSGISLSNSKKLIEFLKEKRIASNSDLAEELKLKAKNPGIPGLTKKLRDLGYLKKVSGKEIGEYSHIQLLNPGRRLIEIVDEPLKLIGWYDAMNSAGGLKYSMLEQTVTPNLKGLWDYRAKYIEPVALEEKSDFNFMMMARTAREKHTEESPRIKIKNQL